jgi:serine protease Do
VLVSGVVAGSPAERAGVQAGDILLAYAGQDVSVRYPEELPALNRLLLGTPVGKEVELTCERAGRTLRLRATTAVRGRAQADDEELASWGATLRDLTLLQAKEVSREPGSGVFVSSLRPGGPAAEAKPPLAASDVIVEVAGHPVKTLADLTAASAQALGQQDKPVPTLVAFERQRERFLTVVRLGEESQHDTSREATKAWLGVDTQVLTRDLAEALGLAGRTGVRITQVHPKSTAEAAGLAVGDVVLKLDGEVISARRPEDVQVFPAMVRQRRIGAKAVLDVVRDGKPLTLEVELAPSPPATRELPEYRDALLEFQARDLTTEDRIEHELDWDLQGALVSGVENGGWASVAHLAVDDVILGVDGQPVRSVDDLKARLQKVAETRPDRVVLFVRRGVHTLFLEIEPAWPNATAKGEGR